MDPHYILFFSQTLFVVKSRVEPAKGSEFCRAGTMCHLQLHVQRVSASSHSSLMYEVLADQTMWAVCGRTAGRFSVSPKDTDFSSSHFILPFQLDVSFVFRKKEDLVQI
jgi:hypothetical protein